MTVSAFLLAILIVQVVFAADVTIDGTPYGADNDSYNASSPSLVFPSDQIGYAFYRSGSPAAGNCVYRKTTDGGTSWGNSVVVDAQTDCIKIAVWYDRWTPGDDTGNNIHILTADSGDDDLFYTRLDTSSDVVTTTVNASTTNQGGSFTAASSVPSITKGTDGDLYMGMLDDTDSFVIKCPGTCETGTNWSEAGTVVSAALDNDWLILMPLSLGNILAIRWDLSLATPDVEYQIFNDSSATWGGIWLDIDTNAPVDTAYDAAFGATLNKATGTISLAYAADTNILNDGNDDVRTASFNGSMWTQKADVLTNAGRGVVGVKIASKDNTDAVYVAYTLRNTVAVPNSATIHWKFSTDSMTSWGGEQGPLSSLADTEIFGASLNIVSDERIYATWFDASNSDLLGASVADLGVTAVEMADFTATPLSGGVLLEWRTGYEAGNLGFNLYRATNGKRVRVNPSIIAGSALVAPHNRRMTAGDSYSWLDPEGSSHSVYYLEDIDVDGTRSMHGPTVPVKGPNVRSGSRKEARARLLSELNHSADQRARKRSSQRGWASFDHSINVVAELTPQSNFRSQESGWRSTLITATNSQLAAQQQRKLAGMAALKLAVKAHGWYRVSRPDLLTAGLDPSADVQYLQLYSDGVEVPIRVNSSRGHGPLRRGDSIEFFGVGMDTPGADTREYWLVVGETQGKRLKSETLKGANSKTTSTSFEYTVEHKERLLYFSGLLNGEEENFFGQVVHEPVNETVVIHHLDRSAIASPLLEVALQGATSTNHKVRVSLNGNEVGVATLTGLMASVVGFPLNSDQLLDGTNTVTLTAENGELDFSLLKYIRVTYAHAYSPDNNYLEFTVKGRAVVKGFTVADVTLIDITDPNFVSLYHPKTELAQDGYRFSVQTTEARKFVALTESRPVKSISRNEPSSWSTDVQGADFIILTHKLFRTSVAPLAALRRNQGLSVAVVDVEDVYDEFSYGAHSSNAIRDFLEWAHTHWRQQPRFVLLVGDGSFDPRGYLGNGETDLLPVRLIDSASLETVSDDWFTDFDNDGVGELALGRLPVRTVTEADLVITKIVDYSLGNLAQKGLFVADRSDYSTDFNFETATDELATLLPPGLGVEKILNAGPTDIIQDRVINGINQGPLLVNFMGHGSVEVWTGDPIFSTSEVESLDNRAQLPVFVLLTCLNAYYQNPERESLAESLMRWKSGGAVAVWSSSGMTEPTSQLMMARSLYQHLFGREPLPLGEAIRQAKLSSMDRDVRRTWILFGDPSMPIWQQQR